jgi:hypothetical protein
LISQKIKIKIKRETKNLGGLIQGWGPKMRV